MQFLLHPPDGSRAVGILPASFNPVTIAHLELAHAALTHVDRSILVLPRVLPHKEYSGASFEQRLFILQEVVRHEPRLGLAVSDSGLFVDVAREFREARGSAAQLWFLCGRDAAERIAGWDYGRAGVFEEMMQEFGLLVAARNGEYVPPAHCAASVREISLNSKCSGVSATLVRECIARGEAWEHLVPEKARELVQSFYGRQ